MNSAILDDDTLSIVLAVKDLLKDLRARGLDDDTIDSLILRDGPGRIILDRRGILTLPDYGGVKIYLNPMERSLYTLMLRHEEGISAEDFWMYYDELCRIYGNRTVYDNPDQIEAAVDALCDDSRATLQTNISRIKRKLVEKVGKNAASLYAITRDKEGVYRISVPRNLVTLD
ncbi:MAG: hypothetical protein IJ584_12965 [Bacteroidales bacterium]|nr:hypothetical protein [Bacteroidales bacterium]